MRRAALASVMCAALAAPAAASPAADAYCDHAEAVAAAESDVLIAPDLFASFGYLDQPSTVDVPDASQGLRVTAGLRYRLGGVYQGLVVRKRARADCRRRRALDAVGGETTYRALEARAEVLDDAMDEAERMLDEANADLDHRRATAQDVTATRLRVDELRAATAAAHQALAGLPAPDDERVVAGAITAYQDADAEVERQDAALRRATAFDVSVRFGYDRFVDDTTTSPLFGVVAVSVNTGILFQGSANAKAARARRKLIETGGGSALDATVAQLKSDLAIESQRADETGILVADLEKQLKVLRSVGGDESRRYRETVWFAWVKAKADHAYLEAHVATLERVLGADRSDREDRDDGADRSDRKDRDK